MTTPTKVVPREPSEAMMRAAVDTSLKFTTLAPMYSTEIRDLWRAMHDAAPTDPGPCDIWSFGGKDAPGDTVTCRNHDVSFTAPNCCPLGRAAQKTAPPPPDRGAFEAWFSDMWGGDAVRLARIASENWPKHIAAAAWEEATRQARSPDAGSLAELKVLMESWLARIGGDSVDAARYRWLRERNVFRSDMPVVCVQWARYDNGKFLHNDHLSHEELDAAIDAAMKEQANG